MTLDLKPAKDIDPMTSDISNSGAEFISSPEAMNSLTSSDSPVLSPMLSEARLSFCQEAFDSPTLSDVRLGIPAANLKSHKLSEDRIGYSEANQDFSEANKFSNLSLHETASKKASTSNSTFPKDIAMLSPKEAEAKLSFSEAMLDSPLLVMRTMNLTSTPKKIARELFCEEPVIINEPVLKASTADNLVTSKTGKLFFIQDLSYKDFFKG